MVNALLHIRRAAHWARGGPRVHAAACFTLNHRDGQ